MLSAGSCAGLAVGSWVQQLCHIQKTALHQTSHPRFSQSFLPFFLDVSWVCDVVIQMAHLRLKLLSLAISSLQMSPTKTVFLWVTISVSSSISPAPCLGVSSTAYIPHLFFLHSVWNLLGLGTPAFQVRKWKSYFLFQVVDSWNKKAWCLKITFLVSDCLKSSWGFQNQEFNSLFAISQWKREHFSKFPLPFQCVHVCVFWGLDPWPPVL